MKKDKKRIVIFSTDIHRDICEEMVGYAKDEAGLHDAEIVDVIWVPGSRELPLIVDQFCSKKKGIDGIVVLGLIVQGKTKHGEVLSHQVTSHLLTIEREQKMPMAISLIGPCSTIKHAKNKAERTARKAVRTCVQVINLLWSFS